MKTKLGKGSTPEPWEIEDCPEEPRIEIRDRNCCVVAVVATLANARLIAKAPLLIEAREVLTAMLAWTTIKVDGNLETAESAMRHCDIMARALLAKLDAE